jgi:hypothetical protein
LEECKCFFLILAHVVVPTGNGRHIVFPSASKRVFNYRNGVQPSLVMRLYTPKSQGSHNTDFASHIVKMVATPSMLPHVTFRIEDNLLFWIKGAKNC